MQIADYIEPNWPQPPNVRALSTILMPSFYTTAGHALGLKNDLFSNIFAGFNLAEHVGDSAEHVMANRLLLQQQLALPANIYWLQQTHSSNVINYLFAGEPAQRAAKDAIFANRERSPQAVCAVLTADCLPVLFSDVSGKNIAAVHAGWRGLLGGVLENTVRAMSDRPHTIMAWFAPCIGAEAYTVKQDVKDLFCRQQAAAADCFTRLDKQHYAADLVALAQLRLQAVGVNSFYCSNLCTYSNPQLFYSYRRRNTTGRFASLIWFCA